MNTVSILLEKMKYNKIKVYKTIIISSTNAYTVYHILYPLH